MSGDRNSEGRALYQSWNDADLSFGSSVFSLCKMHTSPTVYN